MRLSISKIEEFEKCKYSYFLTNIKKEVTQQEPEQLVKGKELHSFFEDIYKEEITKMDIKDFERMKDEKIKAVEQKAKAHPLYSKYPEQTTKFIDFVKKNGIPLYTEEHLYDAELNIAGIIDRVDYDGKDLRILDYKTGKPSDINKHYFQLGIYTYLFIKNHNDILQPTHWGIHYSESGQTITEKIKWNVVRKALMKVSDVRKKIGETTLKDEWNKTPSPLCKWCRHFKDNGGVCDANGKI